MGVNGGLSNFWVYTSGNNWTLKILDGFGNVKFSATEPTYNNIGSAIDSTLYQTLTFQLFDGNGQLTDSVGWKVNGIGEVYSTAVLNAPTHLEQTFQRVLGDTNPNSPSAWTTGGVAAAAPEPASLLLASIGTLAVVIAKKRNKTKGSSRELSCGDNGNI